MPQTPRATAQDILNDPAEKYRPDGEPKCLGEMSPRAQAAYLRLIGDVDAAEAIEAAHGLEPVAVAPEPDEDADDGGPDLKERFRPDGTPRPLGEMSPEAQAAYLRRIGSEDEARDVERRAAMARNAATPGPVAATLVEKAQGTLRAVSVRLSFPADQEPVALVEALAAAGWTETVDGVPVARLPPVDGLAAVTFAKPGGALFGYWLDAETLPNLRELGDILVSHGVSDIRESAAEPEPDEALGA